MRAAAIASTEGLAGVFGPPPGGAANDPAGVALIGDATTSEEPQTGGMTGCLAACGSATTAWQALPAVV